MQAGQAGLARVAVAICFTVTFAWFGVSSFWRVRQKEGSAVTWQGSKRCRRQQVPLAAEAGSE